MVVTGLQKANDVCVMYHHQRNVEAPSGLVAL